MLYDDDDDDVVVSIFFKIHDRDLIFKPYCTIRDTKIILAYSLFSTET
jgi:hypothetical protein